MVAVVAGLVIGGFSALTVGLAMDVKEQGPTVPPRLEAAYRQVAHEKGIDWALLAAWDGAEVRFELPVRSQADIYDELYGNEMDSRRELAEERCRQNPDFCPPVPPSLDPEERELLGQMAYRMWHRLVVEHIGRHADRIRADLETFTANPETGFRKVLPVAQAGRAAELYEGYLILEQLDQDDDHVAEWTGPEPPAEWQPVPGFAWPVSGPITSRYGMRTSPIDGRRRLHAGIDMGVESGTPVKATKAGEVVRTEFDTVYGLVVVVDHGGGYQSLYAHNSRLHVAVGNHVRQGQVMALSGSTGWSTGPHVHFEIHYQGAPVDPLLLLGR